MQILGGYPRRAGWLPAEDSLDRRGQGRVRGVDHVVEGFAERLLAPFRA
jgi:hypothetical protein